MDTGNIIEARQRQRLEQPATLTSLNIATGYEGISHPDKSANICPFAVIDAATILAILSTLLVDIVHDAMELLVKIIPRPR